MANLKNVNLMSQDTFESITPADDELYAVSASGIGFPSSRYEDLILGANGAEYTAPANGWVHLRMNANSGSLAYCELQGVPSGIMSVSNCYTTQHAIEVYIPVTKGSLFKTYYNNATLAFFRFIYAEGE